MEIEMKTIIKQPEQGPYDAHNGLHSLRKASTQPINVKLSPAVARRHSRSTPIDALLVCALAGRKALLRRIVEWRRRAATRRELITLTDRDLRDIGIGRTEAEAEANKPFWET
jgi:uncharacterized protein YjiS (DUF1127 family)